MKGVQCYELFGGIALKIHTFSFFSFSNSCALLKREENPLRQFSLDNHLTLVCRKRQSKFCYSVVEIFENEVFGILFCLLI